jgi:phage major head subunit gpT-like protein
MAIATPALIQALFTGWKGDFQNALSSAPLQYTELATIVPSTTKSNTYGWLGKFPGMREWIGDRVIKAMAAHGYQLTNKKFESTVGVEKDDIEDDNLGIYSPMFQEMGRVAAIQPERLVFEALRQGDTVPCYDGQYFFDSDHPVYPNADGTGAVASVSNLIAEAGYTGPTWYLLDNSRAIKPIIFQDRKKPTLVSMNKIDDEVVFTSDLLRFGVDMRCVAGYGFWQMAVAVKAPLTPDNLWLAIERLRSFCADGGEKLGIKPTHLCVPTSLEKSATKILERELNVDEGQAVSNELKGKVKLLVADYL